LSLLRPRIDLAALLSDPSSWKPETPAGPDSLSAESESSSWTFKNATIRVEEGTITLSPESRAGVTSIEEIDMKAIASWEDVGGQVDIIGLRAKFPEQGVNIQESSSQLVFRSNRWLLNQLAVETESSSLHVP
jgi:hypothetical protein